MLSGSPSRAAAFLGQHSRMGHTRCFEGWNCIPAQWDLPASPVLELLWAYFSKSILSFSFKGAPTSKKCFLLNWTAGAHGPKLAPGKHHRGCQEGITGLTTEEAKLPCVADTRVHSCPTRSADPLFSPLKSFLCLKVLFWERNE